MSKSTSSSLIFSPKKEKKMLLMPTLSENIHKPIINIIEKQSG